MYSCMCCEYSAASFCIMILANHLVTILFIGLHVIKLALYNQSRTLELFVNTGSFCWVSASLMVMYILIAAAINSSKFIEKGIIRSGSKSYRYANPFRLNSSTP